jgi:hypothetical protein
MYNMCNHSSIDKLNSLILSLSFYQVSEEVTARSVNNLNITGYTLSLVGSGTHRVPAQAVCQNNTVGYCSYSYPVQSSSLPNGADYNGQVVTM